MTFDELSNLDETEQGNFIRNASAMDLAPAMDDNIGGYVPTTEAVFEEMHRIGWQLEIGVRPEIDGTDAVRVMFHRNLQHRFMEMVPVGKSLPDALRLAAYRAAAWALLHDARESTPAAAPVVEGVGNFE